VIPVFTVLGCTTLHPVETNPLSVSAEIEAGDHIDVMTTSGQRHEIVVIGVSNLVIEGEAESGEVVAIRYDDIVALQVRRIAPGRTAGLAAGIAAIILAIEFRDFSLFPGG